MSLRPHWLYANYLARHKWFVFREGRKLKVGLWALLKHDWSKFLPSEWFPYAHSFYGKRTEAVKRAFDYAWLLHQKRNPHHWQFWVVPQDSPKSDWTVQAHQPEFGPYWLAYKNEPVCRFETSTGEDTSDPAYRLVAIAEAALASATPKVLPMPDRYRREMVADWRAAGLAQGKPNTRVWYQNNKNNMLLHPETRAWVEANL